MRAFNAAPSRRRLPLDISFHPHVGERHVVKLIRGGKSPPERPFYAKTPLTEERAAAQKGISGFDGTVTLQNLGWGGV